MPPQSVSTLLSELKGRENIYRMVRMENFSVEPYHDGIRIEGSEGERRHRIDMGGPKFYQFAGIPEPLQGKLTRSLLAAIARELVHADKSGRFSVLMAQEEPVCFQTYSAPYVPSHQVLVKVLEQVQPGASWYVDDLQIRPEHADIDIVTDRVVVEPKVGDILRMGLHLSLYDSMYRPTVVEGYTNRLVCGNGMQVRYLNRGYSIHADASSEAVVEQVVARCSRLMAELPAFVDRESQQLMSTRVESPAVAINQIAHDLSAGRQAERVHEAYAQEPGNTMWEVLQAFTRAATSLESYDARTSLRANAGKVLEQASKSRCGACYRLAR